MGGGFRPPTHFFTGKYLGSFANDQTHSKDYLPLRFALSPLRHHGPMISFFPYGRRGIHGLLRLFIRFLLKRINGQSLFYGSIRVDDQGNTTSGDNVVLMVQRKRRNGGRRHYGLYTVPGIINF